MADINSLIAKVRIEIGDLGKSFVTQFTADGTTNRFRLHYSPLEADSVQVYANGFSVTADSHVEESTGMLLVTITPTQHVITAATSNGSAAVYTAPNTLVPGDLVTVSGVSPTGYNGTNMVVTAANSTTFTVAKTLNTAYVSGGVAYKTTVVDVGTAVPKAGINFTVSGTHYRYFTGAEIQSLVETAVAQHTAKHQDVIGRKQLISNLGTIDEYPVAVYASTLALYTLATDASFDIDIQAPDGVNIPRSERYRQLMDMIQARQAQYRELCVMLGIGMYSIDVFTFRRISKTTNRYVPVYKPQEVDDRSFPQRARMPLPTYGNEPTVFPTENGELTAYQGRAFTTDLTLTAKNYAGKTFVANVVLQRGSLQIVQGFELNVNSSLPNFAITNAARTASSTTITLTTNITHNLTVGTSVVITDVDETVNGTRTITAVTSTTFTVTGTATTVLALSALTGTVDVNANQNYIFTLSLTADQTRYLANRTWWEIRTIDPFTDERLVIYESHLFTVRSSEVIL